MSLPGAADAGVCDRTSALGLAFGPGLGGEREALLRKRAASNGLGRTEHARTMGRPTKLTAELSERLCALLADGWFLDHACAEVGVSRPAVETWMAKGEAEDADELHASFLASCLRARAAGERKYLDRIDDIAEETSRQYGQGEGRSRDWKAHAWRLERMNPKRYRETTRQEITGADGGPVKTETVAKVVLFPELEPVEAADPLATEPGSTDPVPGEPGA